MGNCISAEQHDQDTKYQGELHKPADSVLAASATRRNKVNNGDSGRPKLFSRGVKAGGRRLQDDVEHNSSINAAVDHVEMAKRAAEERRNKELETKRIKTPLFRKYAEASGASPNLDAY